MRYLIILAIVLSGSARAGERFYLDRNDGPIVDEPPKITSSTKQIIMDSNAIVLFQCDDGLTRCVEPRTGEVMGCYQRMREAMAAGNAYLPHPLPRISSHDASLTICDEVCEAEKALRLAKQKQTFLEQWNKTLKDCVVEK